MCTILSRFLPLLLLVGCGASREVSHLANVPGAAAAFSLHTASGTSLLVHLPAEEEIRLYDVEGGALTERASLSTPHLPYRAALAGDHILIAYGYSRERLTDPIQVIRYDRSLEQPEVLFTRQSERAEVTELIVTDDRDEVFVAYFASQFQTVAGWLSPANGAFNSVIETRLGMRYDVADGLVVQGRPYGDALGEDGDVILFTGETSERLPSFRGVTEVTFAQLDGDPEREILIGDGWHQDYGDMAEPRVSLLDKQDGSYALTTIAVLESQHAVSTIHPFMMSGKHYLFAAGNSRADIIDLSDGSVRTMHTSEDPYFKAVFAGADEAGAHAAILEEGGLQMRSLPL